MRTWDEKLLEYDKVPIFYKRYIDDGIGIWTHGTQELLKFLEHANKIHENINVELRYSEVSIEFLDTLIKIQDGIISTDLYTKPTDKHQYVQFKSNHPSTMKKSIPYGLGIRIKRICSNAENYTKQRFILKKQLIERGYSGRCIENQLQRVDNLDREELLQRKAAVKPNSDRVPLVVTYSKQLPNIHKIVKKHQDILHKSNRMKEIFKTQPIIAYRRDKNIGDILIHGKTSRVVNSRTVQDSVVEDHVLFATCLIMASLKSLKNKNTSSPESRSVKQ